MLRSDIINKFIKERNYKSYLEIGTRKKESNFDLIQCEDKLSIDPAKESDGDLELTSDEFFKINKKKFDIIFVDGMHEAHQVYRDITNSIECLNTNGVIVCHDCNPLKWESSIDPSYYQGIEIWNGDSWKGFVKYRYNTEFLCYVIDEDEGCGIIDTTKQTTITDKLNVYINEMTFEVLNTKRQELLDLRDWDDSLLK